MGSNRNKNNDRSRRGFLSLFLSKKENTTIENQPPAEMVKMLTPDGKLVEVDKAMLDSIAQKKKASNQEILAWMKNPSTEKS